MIAQWRDKLVTPLKLGENPVFRVAYIFEQHRQDTRAQIFNLRVQQLSPIVKDAVQLNHGAYSSSLLTPGLLKLAVPPDLLRVDLFPAAGINKPA